MARTVIEDGGPGYVEDSSGPALGMVLGVLVGIAVVVLAILFFTGTFDSDRTTIVPGTGSGGGTAPQSSTQPSAPAAPSTAPSK